VLGWLASGLAVVVLVTSVAGWGLLAYYDGKIKRLPGVGSLLAGATDGPVNVLVVGSDSRDGLTPEQRKNLSVGGVGSDTGRRSDTMMLVHVAGDRKSVTVVSLPRDSYVTIPSYSDDAGHKVPPQRNKLNAAYALGGAPLLIRTVQDLTGLEINNYVEVGFAGVVNMVDSLGGVDVCLPTAVDDRRSGLTLPAGRSHVDGETGLSFVRARYIDATADIGRMQRQQQFLGSMFRQATSAGVLLQPTKLNGFLDAALSSITVDDQLSRDFMLSLAGDMAGLKPRDLRFLTVPLANPNGYADGIGSVVIWNKKKAQQVFDSLKADQPLVKAAGGKRVSVAPGDVHVVVLNGSDVSGLATKANDALAGIGFTMAESPGNADRTDVSTTVIRYDPGWSQSVKTLQAALPGAQLEKVDGLGETFQVLVGTGYVDPVPVKVAKAPKVDSVSAADNICG
jgi:LCP family protein required for cell wall assembly